LILVQTLFEIMSEKVKYHKIVTRPKSTEAKMSHKWFVI